MLNYNYKITLVVATLSLVIDQASKYMVTHIMALHYGEAREIVPGFITFILSKNTGINFGLFANGSTFSKVLLAGFAVAVSVALLVWLRGRQPDKLLALGSGLLIGGALGNAIDRLLYSGVIDFLNVTCCGIHNPFAFNIADVWIFVGAALLFIRTANDGDKGET